MTTTADRLIQQSFARQAIAHELLSPSSRVRRQRHEDAEAAFAAEIARQDADDTVPDTVRRPSRDFGAVDYPANEYVPLSTRDSAPRWVLEDSPRGEWPIPEPEPRSWDWVVDDPETERVPGLCVPDQPLPVGVWARDVGKRENYLGPMLGIAAGTALVIGFGIWAAVSRSYNENFGVPERPRVNTPKGAAATTGRFSRVVLKPGFANANLRAEPWGDVVGHVLPDSEVEVFESRSAADPNGTMARWHRVRSTLDNTVGWLHGSLLPGVT